MRKRLVQSVCSAACASFVIGSIVCIVWKFIGWNPRVAVGIALALGAYAGVVMFFDEPLEGFEGWKGWRSLFAGVLGGCNGFAAGGLLWWLVGLSWEGGAIWGAAAGAGCGILLITGYDITGAPKKTIEERLGDACLAASLNSMLLGGLAEGLGWSLGLADRGWGTWGLMIGGGLGFVNVCFSLDGETFTSIKDALDAFRRRAIDAFAAGALGFLYGIWYHYSFPADWPRWLVTEFLCWVGGVGGFTFGWTGDITAAGIGAKKISQRSADAVFVAILFSVPCAATARFLPDMLAQDFRWV